MPAPKTPAELDPDYVYIIYIAATPQKIWDALTDSRTERAWWAGTRQDSTFKPGDSITYLRNGKVDVRGEILEREEPHRLVYSFHVEGPGPVHDEGASIVTYEIHASGEMTKVKIIHSNFPKDSLSRKGVEGGWPAILSSLKTILEGGGMPKFSDWGEEEFKAAQEKHLREHLAGKK